MDDSFIEFDEKAAWQRVKRAAEISAKELKNSHPWTDRTGDMADSIPSRLRTTGEEIELRIDVPYASYVDKSRPFLDELEQTLDTLSERLLLAYLDEIGVE